jgi:hypothetical protein
LRDEAENRKREKLECETLEGDFYKCDDGGEKSEKFKLVVIELTRHFILIPENKPVNVLV